MKSWKSEATINYCHWNAVVGRDDQGQHKLREEQGTCRHRERIGRDGGPCRQSDMAIDVQGLSNDLSVLYTDIRKKNEAIVYFS